MEKQCFRGRNVKKAFPNHKIIVASLAYPEIRAVLREHGLKELEDFCDSRYFLSAHAVTSDNKLYLARTDLSMTEYCNLRCKNCNMLMPYFKHPKHRDLEQLKEDIDTYFNWVDQVQVFNLLGGEPFLYPHVLELTKYLCENYRNRIDQVVFFSNGTLIPSEELLKLMREYEIEVQVSDYRKGLPHVAEKVDRFQMRCAYMGFGFAMVWTSSGSALASRIINVLPIGAVIRLPFSTNAMRHSEVCTRRNCTIVTWRPAQRLPDCLRQAFTTILIYLTLRKTVR